MISKGVRIADLPEHKDVLKDVRNVPIKHNSILNAIIKEISVPISEKLIGKTFIIAPDNKYLIKIQNVTAMGRTTEITLDQNHLHFDAKRKTLVPYVVRNVVISAEV